MLDRQSQGPLYNACNSPMRLTVIEPSMWGQDVRSFACPQCSSSEQRFIESAVTEAWLAPARPRLNFGTPVRLLGLKQPIEKPRAAAFLTHSRDLAPTLTTRAVNVVIVACHNLKEGH
jgi:hypothetical protein